jgi:hypothetical protein
MSPPVCCPVVGSVPPLSRNWLSACRRASELSTPGFVVTVLVVARELEPLEPDVDARPVGSWLPAFARIVRT